MLRAVSLQGKINGKINGKVNGKINDNAQPSRRDQLRSIRDGQYTVVFFN